MFQPEKNRWVALSVVLLAAAPASMARADGDARPNQFWWPDQFNLAPLRQHTAQSDPMGQDFNYARAFESLDLNAVS